MVQSTTKPSYSQIVERMEIPEECTKKLNVWTNFDLYIWNYNISMGWVKHEVSKVDLQVYIVCLQLLSGPKAKDLDF